MNSPYGMARAQVVSGGRRVAQASVLPSSSADGVALEGLLRNWETEASIFRLSLRPRACSCLEEHSKRPKAHSALGTWAHPRATGDRGRIWLSRSAKAS